MSESNLQLNYWLEQLKSPDDNQVYLALKALVRLGDMAAWDYIDLFLSQRAEQGRRSWITSQAACALSMLSAKNGPYAMKPFIEFWNPPEDE